MIRILANDGMDSSAVQTLKDRGYDVVTESHKDEALDKAVTEFDVIVVRSATKVREPLIDKMVDGGKMKLIIRAGVGIDNIDHEYAKSKGIEVRNTPNASSASVAELAIGHMIAISRFIPISNVTMRKGEWNKKAYKGVEISGKTLGVIGFGRIGQEVAKRAVGLGMTVIYTDSSDNQSPEYKKVELDELLAKSDYITLHVPFKGEVIIGKEEFAKMKDGVRLLQLARGKVVDEKALLDALNSGKVAAAALDVFEKEPTDNSELCNHPNVSVTPHIGASTAEAQKRIGVETIETIEKFFK